MIRLESQFESFSAKQNESLMVYLFTVIGSNIDTKNFANLEGDLPIANKIGRDVGAPNLSKIT